MRRVIPRDSPYEMWLKRAKTEIPVFEGLVIDDVRTVEVKSRSEMEDDIKGLYLRFQDQLEVDLPQIREEFEREVAKRSTAAKSK